MSIADAIRRVFGRRGNDDVQFCRRLTLEGFEHLHARHGRPYRVVIASEGAPDVAERAAHLYLAEATSIERAPGAPASADDHPATIVVRAEPGGRGRYRFIVEPASSKAGN